MDVKTSLKFRQTVQCAKVRYFRAPLSISPHTATQHQEKAFGSGSWIWRTILFSINNWKYFTDRLLRMFDTLNSLINEHTRLLFSRKKSSLLALIWGHFTGKQHQILTNSFIKSEEKFQHTRLLESCKYVPQPTWLLNDKKKCQDIHIEKIHLNQKKKKSEK